MKYLKIAMLLLLPLCSVAQHNLTARLVDKDTQPVAFANALLFQMPDSTFYKATTSDELGKLSFTDVVDGDYALMISSVGYVTLSRKLTINSSTDLNDLVMSIDQEQLDAVTVTAKRPTVQRKPDRIIFNVENTSVSTGNAAQILRSTPGIFEMNGSYTVKGSTAQVYINNKRVFLTDDELQQLLNGYNGDNVKSVEVIFNPPAMYDADGGAVINIITSKNVSLGYKGSVTGNWQIDEFAKYQIGTSQFYKKDWLSVYANYNYNPRKDLTLQESEVGFFNSDGTRNSRWFTDVEAISRSDAHALNSIIDITLDEKNTLSFMGYLGLNNDRELDRDVSTTIVPQGATMFSGFDTASRIGQDYSSGHANLSWLSVLNDNGGNLKVEGTYIFTNNENTQNFASRFFDNTQTTTRINNFRTIGFQKANIFSGKVDYIDLLGSYVFSTGLKFTNISNQSNQDFFDTDMGAVRDPSLSDNFLYDEQIYAAYSQLSRDWDKWAFSAGLRLEQTNVEGNSVSLGLVNKQNYLGVFPNLSISNNLNDKNYLNLSYKRSIERPGAGDLNPFNNFINDNNLSTGTPDLIPAFTNKITLGWVYNNELFIDAYYIHTENMINTVAFQNNDTNVLEQRSINLNYEFQYSIDAMLYKDLSDSWSNTTSVSMFYMENEVNALQSPIRPQQSNTIGFYIDMYNNFELSKDKSLKMNINTSYVSSILFGTYLYKNLFTSEIGFSKSIWNKRALLTASYRDIFNTANQPFTTRYQNQDNSEFIIAETQLFSLGFTYKFGNFRLESREPEPLEEQERTGKKTKGF